MGGIGAADALMGIFGLKRVKPKATRSNSRRGRVVDKDYLAWMAAQPCMISGRRATVHHVRRCGEPKNDRRTLPLVPEYHLIQWGPKTSIEALGKAKFEARYGVDIEASIVKYNARYEARTGSIVYGGGVHGDWIHLPVLGARHVRRDKPVNQLAHGLNGE